MSGAVLWIFHIHDGGNQEFASSQPCYPLRSSQSSPNEKKRRYFTSPSKVKSQSSTMPEGDKPAVQEAPKGAVPEEGPKTTNFLKVDRSLRPEGFHIEGSGAK
ncbi:expressed unknown protein [Seminavis robusta]|uniref:Uncharacterized protein n=1 Tax=Seminavis robusta TaxID=568900 RepID=A0A9N8ECV5_9STRA|nr:expressed unknown protein [Seminavis robusta]|eukprot:Sro760_g198380.1 n/a (103) ;mRNA; r:26959-27267